jgi:hypothetical protein
LLAAAALGALGAYANFRPPERAGP